MLPDTPQAYESGRPRVERASPEWRSGALPSELRRPRGTPGWSRTSGLCRRRTALYPLSYGRRKMTEPPAGVEPAPRPYKGRVLSVDTTEAKVETAGVEPAPPRCKRGALPPELHPPGDQRWGDADGWSRTTTVRGTAFTARGAHQLLSVRMGEGGRPGSNRRRRGSQPRMLPSTPRPPRSGDDRTRTGGLSPDKRALWRV
jgi:hypothetical protein